MRFFNTVNPCALVAFALCLLGFKSQASDANCRAYDPQSSLVSYTVSDTPGEFSVSIHRERGASSDPRVEMLPIVGISQYDFANGAYKFLGYFQDKQTYMVSPGSKVKLKAGIQNFCYLPEPPYSEPCDYYCEVAEFVVKDKDEPPFNISARLTSDGSQYHKYKPISLEMSVEDDKGITSTRLWMQASGGEAVEVTRNVALVCSGSTSYRCSTSFTASGLTLSEGSYKAWWQVTDIKGQSLNSPSVAVNIIDAPTFASITSPSRDINDRYIVTPTPNLSIPISVRVQDDDDPITQLKVYVSEEGHHIA